MSTLAPVQRRLAYLETLVTQIGSRLTIIRRTIAIVCPARPRLEVNGALIGIGVSSLDGRLVSSVVIRAVGLLLVSPND